MHANPRWSTRKKDSPPWGAVSFLHGDSNQNRKPRGNCGFALPVAEKARPQFPQRSKNARIGVSPMRFSGPARWNVHEPVRTLANSFISFHRLPQGEKRCMRIPAGAPEKKTVPLGGLSLFFTGIRIKIESPGGIAALRCQWQKKQGRNFRSGRKTRGSA